jgi:hypothetical protein
MTHRKGASDYAAASAAAACSADQYGLLRLHGRQNIGCCYMSEVELLSGGYWLFGILLEHCVPEGAVAAIVLWLRCLKY